MKNNLWVVLAALLVAASAPAQLEDDHSVALTRSAIATERQAILTANLELTDAQAAIFWPMHDEYRQELDAANNTRVDLLKRYFANYETLTDDEAAGLLFDHIVWEEQVLKIQKKHAKKMAKVLPGRLVAKFFQIENKMDIIVEYEMAGEVPLIK